MRNKNRIWNITLTAIIIVSGAFGVFLYYYDNKTYTKEEIEGWFEPITSKYGITIIYEIGEDFFSPLENPVIPAGPLQNSKVGPIRHRVLQRYPDILQRAFEKYPIDVIQQYLETIQLAGEIDAGIVDYGGAYDPFRKIIYLVDNGAKSDDLMIETFHHEFSSLLLLSHSFYVNPWTDHNPKEFEYFSDIYSDYETMKTKRNVIADYYDKGMVTNYGLSSFEDDFNEYSAMIFTYPQEFKKIMNQYPRIRGKFLVWLKFYKMLNPIFTEAYLLGES